MARPWRKKSAWPCIAKSGRRSYTLGFYDHDRVERSRAFPSVRHARAWMDDYITAERRGRHSLRRFLLDLDAKEANEAEVRTIGEVLELYLAVNAHPRNQGGLAPSTFERYTSVANRHLLGKPRRGPRGEALPRARYAVAVASVPAVRFNEPQAPRAWHEEMMGRRHPQAHPRTRVEGALRRLELGCRLANGARDSKPMGASSPTRESSTDAAQPAGAGRATPPLVAVADRVSPAGRSLRRPWRQSASRCSCESRAGTRSSRTETPRS